MNINCIPVAKQKDLFVGKAALIASFRAITKQEKIIQSP
jgi:hypothetical protein